MKTNDKTQMIINRNSLEKVDEILRKYDNTEFSPQEYKGVGVNITKDYEGQRIKNGDYKFCNFICSNFTYAGVSGTRFLRCNFDDCAINGANLQFCDFSRSTFRCIDSDNAIRSCNFNQSSFYHVRFENINIENTSMSYAQFLETEIVDSSFRHVTLQDNIFRNVTFQNTSFIGCNFEYSEFDHVTMDNTVLPFHQIPYIYGGLQYLQNTNENILITSSMENAPILSPEEYLSLMPVFVKYYQETNDFFPLANIYLSTGETGLAHQAVLNGFKEYINNRDFRKLKSLCKLATKSVCFDRHKLSEFYFDIIRYFMSVEVSENEMYQYGMHIDEIKNILTGNKTDIPHILVALKTNFTIEDSHKLGEFLELIEKCLKYNNIPEDNYSLEVKHNSLPLSVWVAVSSLDPNALIMFVGMIYAICTGQNTLLGQALAVCAEVATVASFLKSLNSPSDIHSHDSESYQKETLVAKATNKYVSQKHAILKSKNIKVKFSIGYLNFNFESKRNYQ